MATATATDSRIQKLLSLYKGGATEGERAAAKAALDRMGWTPSPGPDPQSFFEFASRFQRENREVEGCAELAFSDSMERAMAIYAGRRFGLRTTRRKAIPRGRRKPKKESWENKIIVSGPKSKVSQAADWYDFHIAAMKALLRTFRTGYMECACEVHNKKVDSLPSDFQSIYYSGWSAAYDRSKHR